jgi:TRAP-type C4-dicarboxylate transport system permease large subunit
MVLNLMIGVVTPPVGMSLFVVSKISGLSVGTIGKASIPFIIPLIAVLALVTYIPAISLWLPNLFMK